MKIEKYLCIDKAGVAHGGKIYSREKIESLEIPDWEEIFIPLSFAKWAIKVTDSNRQQLIVWVQSKPDFDKDFGANNPASFNVGEYVISHCSDKSYQHWSNTLPEEDGYTEIDFETFKEITGMGEEKDWREQVAELKEKLKDVEPLKIFTIEDVRNGKCAIDFDDMLQLPLKRLLTLSFPDDTTHPNYNHRYFYSFNAGMSEEFDSGMVTDLPTQSVKLFLSQIEGKKEDKGTWNNPYTQIKERWYTKNTTQMMKESLEKNQPTDEWQPKWISAENALPDDSHGRVLVWVKEINDLGISEYCWNCSFDTLSKTFSDNFKIYNVTHWMPLPDKPLEAHTFTTEQAKQYLAKLHNLNVNQIKIVE